MTEISSKHLIALKINVGFFLFLLIVVVSIFFLLPKQNTSIQEQRNLANVPVFTFKNYIDGALTDQIERYYDDHFPFRFSFIAAANYIKSLKGFKNQEYTFYAGRKKIKNINGPLHKLNLNYDSLVLLNQDSILKYKVEDFGDYESINNIIVYNHAAIQSFSGSKALASAYAKLITEFVNVYPDLKIGVMVVPVGSDFFLPKSYSSNQTRERDFISYLYSQCESSVIKIPAYSELINHINEYIQFRTDHHWTGLGAYYAYRAFCYSYGFSPLPIESLSHKSFKHFVGSMYNYTQSNELLKHFDTVHYYKIPTQTKSYIYKTGIIKGIPGNLYSEYGGYGVFLGGDWPLMQVKSGIKNGRKILVFKDSYGNAFCTYLPSHFEEVFIIDYRYFNGNLKDLISNNGITDILFAHNVFVANSGFTILRERNMLNLRFGSTSKKNESKRIVSDSAVFKLDSDTSTLH
jgi:hypothetical protein